MKRGNHENKVEKQNEVRDLEYSFPASDAENVLPCNHQAHVQDSHLSESSDPLASAGFELEISGPEEVRLGYNLASSTYDSYWLPFGSGPTTEMFEHIEEKAGGHAIDCGSGTGFSTAMLARKVGDKGSVLAIDVSEEMTRIAKKRLENLGISNVEFIIGEIFEKTKHIPESSFDIAVIAWVIGYVSCEEIFPVISRVLKPGGEVGFVCHQHRSPLIPFEAFEEIALADPGALSKLVVMTLPDGADETARHLRDAGLYPKYLQEGTFTIRYASGREVYESIMKAGLAASFYYSIRPEKRDHMAELFIHAIDKRSAGEEEIEIAHKYLFGVAVKKSA